MCLATLNHITVHTQDLLKNRRHTLPVEYYTLHNRLTTNPEDLYNEIPPELHMNIWYSNPDPDPIGTPLDWMTDEQLKKV